MTIVIDDMGSAGYIWYQQLRPPCEIFIDPIDGSIPCPLLRYMAFLDPLRMLVHIFSEQWILSQLNYTTG